MHGAAAEAALVHQLQVEAHAGGQGARAAADEHRHQDQVQLVHDPGGERLARQLGPADGGVPAGAVDSRRAAAGSNSRSTRVRAVEAASSVRE